MSKGRRLYGVLIGVLLLLLLGTLYWLGYHNLLLARMGLSKFKLANPDPSTFPPAPAPVTGSSYDVLVVGGEPEGIAAAVSAARQGVKVLLVDKRDGLGGLFTYGWLNFIDMNFGPRWELLTRGTFQEFYQQVKGEVFDVEEAKEIFSRMVGRYPNLAVSLNTIFRAPLMEGNKIVGIEAVKGGEVIKFYGQRVIDATQDADVAAAAGVPYTVGAEDIGEKERRQSVTLIFRIKGVDWEALGQAVKKGQIKDAKISSRAAWGFSSVTKQYQPSTPRLRLRGLNIGRQKDGTVLINALQIFGVDGLNEASKREGMELARKELPAIVAFLQEKLPGFKTAELDGWAPELYVRETRHIKAEYQLDINDVVFNRDFPDRIAHGSYPVDVQATSPQDTGYVYGRPVMYSIPFRSLVPLKVENLLVVGRSAGYTHLASGSTRVVPVGMATGDAAGVAAAYSLHTGKSFREIARSLPDVQKIQEILLQQGAYLKAFEIPNPLEGHWAYPALKFVNHWGLVVAGYDNNWRLEEPISRMSFYYMTANAIKRAVPEKAVLVQARAEILKPYLEARPLTRGEAAKLLLAYLGEDISRLDPQTAVLRAGQEGLLPLQYTGREPSANLTYAEAYYATERLCAYLGERK
ncbi:FAD dependent oxidoreductase [Thermanaeromonas toyohensis ToBE]|uniref:FAD dependent oxidoreductase n=1 Tax=Thermanaeromonas toyohensis ToBE TaxID=698762 RepID=A0A1W1VXU4_9FIRM|nr:FAD dependent oxidoreductase [Thermanaeromonas toyohensis ToBE]